MKHFEGEENRGILYMLIASFCFALSGACARWLSDDIHPVQLVFFRNLIGVGFIFYSMWKTPIVQKGGKFLLLIFRGIIGTLALFTFYYGVATIGLGLSITYQQSYPVFLSIFAFWYYREHLRASEWTAVFIGFIGICLIFIPSVDATSMSTKHHLIGLSNAIMTGMAYLSIRELSQYYDQRSIVMSFMGSGIVLPFISLLLGQWFEADNADIFISDLNIPSLLDYPVVLLLGMTALFGQIYLTKAFSYQKTGVIAAVGYSNIFFSVIFGIILGDKIPDAVSLVGIMMIIICGVMISFKAK